MYHTADEQVNDFGAVEEPPHAISSGKSTLPIAGFEMWEAEPETANREIGAPRKPKAYLNCSSIST